FSLKSSVLKSVYPRAYTERHLKFSHLTFMDDSTLVASSKDGLSMLLSITEEFYTLNNTKANHSKYVLLSTELVNPEDIIFSLTSSSLNNTSQILIRSLGHKDSFRFLGVWFDLSFSKCFVHSQLKKEYLQFTNILRHKKLTGKQLTYLHNSVLLPKVEYRAQVAPLTINECRAIASPFNMMFKSKLNLSKRFPDVGLHSKHHYNLIRLYDHLLQHHISSLYLSINSPSLIGDMMKLRLDNLQSLMWLPYSPLSVTDWSRWTHLKAFKSDFVAMTLSRA